MSKTYLMAGVILNLAVMFLSRPIMAETNEIFSIPPAKEIPSIDSRMSSNEWQDALSVYGALEPGGNFEPRPAIFYFTYSVDRIFFAIRSELPPVGQLKADVKQDGLIAVAADDSWEVWLNPLYKDRKDQDILSYQLIGNVLGFKYNSYWEVQGTTWKPLDWNPSWNYASSTTDRWWVAEGSIPLADIGITSQTGPWRLKFNLCRGYQNPAVGGSLSGSSNFGDSKQMALLIPDPGAPIVKLRKIKEDSLEDMKMTLDIRNPLTKEINVNVWGEIVSPIDSKILDHQEKSIKIPPGENVSVQLLNDIPFHDMVEVSFWAGSEDMSKTYFSHKMKFGKFRDKRWGPAGTVSPLSVMYLPSFNKLEVNYNCKQLIDKGEKIDKVRVIVRSEKDQQEIFKAEIKSFGKINEAEAIYSLPSLNVGKYIVEAVPYSGSKASAGEAVTFEKKEAFEWENNNLGISDEIIPPFTPMKVKKKTVNVVLREMEMNQFGLWNRVKSLNQDILAAPMVIRGECEGREIDWKGDKPRLTEEREDRVVYVSEARSKLAVLTAKSTLEYDGFMKVEMDLTPLAAQAVDRITLDLVLPDNIAYLMHAVNEWGRNCPAGSIPPGTGIVWSNRLMPSQWENKFVPYIWIGGEEKGICWMANDEKDWSLDPKQPMMELIREKNTVKLRLHFINHKTILNRKRQWLFGLMATPVKPMPKGWRKWNWLWFNDYAPAIWCDPFPKDRDFSLFAGLKKTAETGEIDQTIYSQWLNKFSGHTKTDKRNTLFLKEVFQNCKRVSPVNNKKGTFLWDNPEFNQLYGRYVGETFPDVMLYMDPMHVSSITPDALYFQGEWRIRPQVMMYSEYNDIPTYMAQLAPKSYQDFWLYYCDKMLATDFVKILMLDEVVYSVKTTYNPGIGKGFIDENGKMVGSRSLFELREFIKRLATLYHRRKMYPKICPHVTNQVLIPCLSFASMFTDWEDKYASPNSFLRRFPGDFVRAESIGLQAGCVPVCWYSLAGAPTNKFSMAQLARSYWANILLHGIGAAHCMQSAGLVDFGYWDDDCEFVPYWNNKGQVKAEQDNLKISYYQKKGKVLIIVVNYGSAGDYPVMLDMKALGLTSSAIAIDPETRKAWERISEGKWKISIPREDYCLALVKTD